MSATRNEDAPTLAQRAYARIEEMIVSGALAPGETVSELGLAERLQFGRTPVREALQRLQARQMVTVLPRRGAVVTDASQQEFAMLLEARWPFERLIAQLAARHATPQQRQELAATADALVAAARAQDNAAVIALDRELKEQSLQATQNKHLAEAVGPIHALSRRLYFTSAREPVVAVALAHAAVYRAIAAGDVDTAVALVDQVMQAVAAVTLGRDPALA